MNIDNDYKRIYCEENNEYYIYCDICENFCIERYYKNHLKSGIHINNFFKRKTIKLNDNLININERYKYY